MPCVHNLIGSPGDTFRFRIAAVDNVLACIGRLRVTGPGMGHTLNFTLAQLQAGIDWLLQPDMTYTLRIIVQPHDPQQPVQIDVQTSAGEGTCSRDGAGQIGVWTIDVL